MKRKERGLIPPNQFGKKGIDSRGFRGGIDARFHGREKRERMPGWRNETTGWVGPTGRARSQRACILIFVSGFINYLINY